MSSLYIYTIAAKTAIACREYELFLFILLVGVRVVANCEQSKIAQSTTAN